MRSRNQRGFVLIAMCVTMLLLVAFVGLAFDLGRIYIARNEAQVYTDAAALTAAARLDGTLPGIQKARDAVRVLPGQWNLGTQPFKEIVTEFSADGEHWTLTPEKEQNATGTWMFARITAPANDLDVIFLRAVGGPTRFRILARSSAQASPTRLVE